MSVFRIHHITRYRYDRPVKESVNQISIYPVADQTQEILEHDISISNNPEIFAFSDYWGNKTGCFSILDSHKELVIDNKMVVRTLPAGTPGDIPANWQQQLTTDIENNVPLLELTQQDDIKNQDKIESILAEIRPDKNDLLRMLEEFNEYVFKNFSYIKGITDIETTIDEILEHRSGVCQDFAHVLLQLLRTTGIPCRYVSGYICPNRNGMRGEGATHAWVEIYIPGMGWRGIDPTNNIWVNDTHIKLAVGRNFKDCTPVKGTYKGPANEVLSVYVSVGYEDGNKYEDINDVQLQAQLFTEEVSPLPDIEHQQQQ